MFKQGDLGLHLLDVFTGVLTGVVSVYDLIFTDPRAVFLMESPHAILLDAIPLTVFIHDPVAIIGSTVVLVVSVLCSALLSCIICRNGRDWNLFTEILIIFI